MPPQENPPQNTPTPSAPEAPTTPAAPAAPVPPKKGMPKWLKIVLIGAAVFVVLVGTFILVVFKFTSASTKDAEVTSTQFLDNIQADNSTAAYQLANTAFTANTSAEDFSALVDQISPALQGNESIVGRRIVSENGNEFVALVYSIATDKGTVYARVVLQKDGSKQGPGAWRVQNFRSSQSALEPVLE